MLYNNHRYLARKRGEVQMLNSMEQRKYEIIGKVVNGELTRKEAMFELNKSRQQIYRLIQVYEEQGEQGFIHKNRNKKSIRKIIKVQLMK